MSQFDKYKVIARTSDLSVASFDDIVDSIVWEERRRDGVEEFQGDWGARPGQSEAFFPDFEDAEKYMDMVDMINNNNIGLFEHIDEWFTAVH